MSFEDRVFQNIWGRDGERVGLSSASTLCTTSPVASSCASSFNVHGYDVDIGQLKRRLRADIMKELKEEGKAINKKMSKPLSKERRKRKLDVILNKEEEEDG